MYDGHADLTVARCSSPYTPEGGMTPLQTIPYLMAHTIIASGKEGAINAVSDLYMLQ